MRLLSLTIPAVAMSIMVKAAALAATPQPLPTPPAVTRLAPPVPVATKAPGLLQRLRRLFQKATPTPAPTLRPTPGASYGTLPPSLDPQPGNGKLPPGLKVVRTPGPMVGGAPNLASGSWPIGVPTPRTSWGKGPVQTTPATISPGVLPWGRPATPATGSKVPSPPALPGVAPASPMPPAAGYPAGAPGQPVSSGSVRILSDYVRYDRNTKQAIARGNVRVLQDDTTITTEEAHYDQGNRITNIMVPFQLVQTPMGEPRTTLTGNRLTDYHREKHVVVDGQVRLFRQGEPTATPADSSRKARLKNALKREDTVIQSDHMDYWLASKDARFEKEVKFYKKDKFATADHAYNDNGRKTFTMDDNVVLTQIRGDWLGENGIVDTSTPDRDRDAALREKTTISGDHMVINQQTNDATITGKLVAVVQRGRRATGKRAEYSDAKSTITLTQDVKIAKDDGGYMAADRAIFHTDSERFEAYGTHNAQVETDFNLEDAK